MAASYCCAAARTCSAWTSPAPRRSTGWDLPLKALPYWLKGLPVPQRDVAGVELDDNLLRRFYQDGWQVTYHRYQQFGEWLLPVRMEVSRGDTSARLVIRQWTALAG